MVVSMLGFQLKRIEPSDYQNHRLFSLPGVWKRGNINQSVRFESLLVNAFLSPCQVLFLVLP